MKIKRKILAALTAAAIACTCTVPQVLAEPDTAEDAVVSVASTTASGTCGENLTWTLADGVLTIGGSGDMTEWSRPADVPWYDYNSEITEVVIKDGVTSIGDWAFYECTNLTNITISDSVTSINGAAFWNCESLTSITLPSSITSIGSAFGYCTSLTSITIPEGVTSIDAEAFYECTGLTSVTIPSSVTSIGAYAFYACAFTNIIIPEGVTKIDEFAFFQCWNLENVTIPGSVISIGNMAFWQCDSLTSVTILNGVTSIGERAFGDCTNLTSVTIPDSVTTIALMAFFNCPNLTNVIVPNGITNIGYETFAFCDGLTSITLPNSINSIDYAAFYNCPCLETVYYTGTKAEWDSITIDSENDPLTSAEIIFLGEGSVTSLEITSLPTKFDYNTGEELDTTGLVVVATYDSGNSFELTGYTLTGYDSTTVGEQEITVSYGGLTATFTVTVREITASGTCGDDLTWVLYSDGVLEISGTGAMNDYLSGAQVPWYKYRTSITSVVIGDEVTTIGTAAFYSCTSLTEINIPAGMTSIGAGAFTNTGSVSINVDEDNEYYSSIDGVLFNKDQTEIIIYGKDAVEPEYTIPDGVTSIGSAAFSYSANLTSITIPSSVTSIGGATFGNCTALKEVTFTNSVTTIEAYAFYGSTALETVYFMGTPSEWNAITIGVGNDPLTSANIVTPPANLTGIHIESLPNSTTIVMGTEPDWTGLVVMADYDDGSSVEITDYEISISSAIVAESLTQYLSASDSSDTELSVYSFDTDEVGTAIVTVTYEGFTATFEIEIVEPSISGIEITSMPDNTTVIEGTELDTTGLVVSALYDNNTSTVVTDYTLDYDTSAVGMTTVSITYEEFTATFEIEVVVKTLTGIELTSLPDKTTYYVGDELDLTGLAVTAYYNNGTSEETTDYTVSGYDADTSGEQTITVTYGEFEAAFSVTVIGILASGTCGDDLTWTLYTDGTMIIDGMGAMDDYSAGSEVPWNTYREKITNTIINDGVTSIGMVAFYYCTNMTDIYIPASVTSVGAGAFTHTGSVEITVDKDNAYYSSVDGALFNKAQTEIVAYAKDAIEPEYIIPDTVTSIASAAFGYSEYITSITIPATVTSIGSGTFGYCTALKEITLYNSLKLVNLYAFYGCSALETVYFNGTETEWNSVIISLGNTPLTSANIVFMQTEPEPAQEVGISVTPPTNTTVVEGTELDTTGLTVMLEYDDGTSVEVTDYELSGYDTGVIGTQTVTVTYEGFTAEFDIEVVKKTLTGIEITALPDNTTAVEGTELDLTGLVVTAKYDNGTSEAISDYTVSYDTSTAGDVTVTITYKGFTATFNATAAAKTLTGISITSTPTNTNIVKGTELDTTGLVVTASYNNGTSAAVTGYELLGYDTSVIGTQTVTVTYGGFTVTFDITVVDKTLTGIAITSQPTNTTSIEGTTLDITGLVVTAYYNNGTSAEITDYVLSGYDKDTIGEQTITVTYGGFTATFTVTVTAKSVTGIAITTMPTKRSYYVGDTLDTTGMVVTATYNNGITAEITDYDESGFDSTTAGTKTITVTYGDFTTTFNVTVETKTDTAAKPKIGIGSYIGGKTVTLTSTDEGATIYYTTDGTVPTEESLIYTEPIVLTETATVKAMSVVTGMYNSLVASGKISVSQVADITASHAAGEWSVGTIITLSSSTTGTTIYYTTDGSTPSTKSTKYSSGIAITTATTIKAIAVKDGYKSSNVFTISYTVPTKQAGTATVSIGSVTAKAGDDISVPVYVFLDDDEMLKYCRLTMSYDASVFEYASITPADGISSSDMFVSASSGEVTVLYYGNAVEAGELCSINLTALASATDGVYSLTASGVSVSSETTSTFEMEIIDGDITLSGSNNSTVDRYAAEVVLTSDANNGNEVTSAEELTGEISANITIDDTVGTSSVTTANIILVIYDRNGALITLQSYETDLSDTSMVYTHSIKIPDGAVVGSIKMLIWGSLNDPTPLAAASSII